MLFLKSCGSVGHPLQRDTMGLDRSHRQTTMQQLCQAWLDPPLCEVFDFDSNLFEKYILEISIVEMNSWSIRVSRMNHSRNAAGKKG